MKTVFVISSRKTLCNTVSDVLDSKYEVSVIPSFKSIFSASADEESVIILHTNSIKENPYLIFKKIGDYYQNTPMLVLSDTPGFRDGATYLKHGAKGYGNSYIAPEPLKQAVDMIFSGNVWLYPEFNMFLIRSINNTEDMPIESLKENGLSKRESEIALCVVKGMHNNEISALLNIAESTVKAHITKIYSKMGVKDRISLALKYKTESQLS